MRRPFLTTWKAVIRPGVKRCKLPSDTVDEKCVSGQVS